MKKTYLFIAVLIAAIFSTNAQTDVTSTYISNSNFDSGYDYAAAATGNLATGATSKKALSGWTATSGTNSCAGVFEYGTAATFNSATVPDKNYAEATAGGCIAFSNGWGESLVYTTTDEITLPVGTYKFIYAANNRIAMPMGASRFGFVPTSGTAKYTSRVASSYFALNTWVADTVTFTIATPTPGRFSIGYVAVAGVGSGSSAKLCVDFVKLLIMPVDKTSLQSLLTTANSMKANPQPVGTSTAYADLDAAITAAQTVYDNASATAPEVIAQETALNAAIAKVNSAILLYQRISTWTTLPYDATSAIINPSFESATANGQTNHTGWTNVGGFKTQNNTSFIKKQGTYYVEQWKSAGGNWTGLKLSQVIKDIPNGIYKLTAGALNEPITTGGAFVYANEVKAEIFATQDYTITVTVTNNQLEIGYEVVNGGNYVAVDNFRLSYISDGSPYLLVSPENLFFDLMTSTKTFTVGGGNLTANATLTAPAGITLNKTTLTSAEVAAGATITATHDGSTVIASGEIVISTTGATNSIVTVNAQPDNATSAIVNPNFSNGTAGWTSTTTAQNKTTATNQNVGAFEGTMPFYENWNGSAYTGKIYQVVNGLPAGRYLLKMGVFANNGGEGLFVYGDNYETAVSNASVPAFFEVEFVTPGGSAEIGLNIKSGTNNWVGIDNVSLKYLGAVSAPLTSVSTTNILLTEASLSKTFTLTGANLTADVSLVSSVAGVTVLPATISKDDAELATGKTVTVTFDPAATGAGSLTGTITVSTAGVDDKVIAVATSKDSECFTPLYNDKTNLVTDPYCNDRSKFGGWGNVEVSNTTALCGLRSLKVYGGSLDVSIAGGAAIASNKTYRVKTNIFVPTGHTAKFGLFLIGNSGDVDVYTSKTNDTWEVVDFTFKTATVGTGGVYFQRATGADGVYVDNYEMYEVAEPTIRIKYVDADNETITLKDDRVHTSTWGATVANYLMIGKTFTAPASDKEDITFGSYEYNYEATSVDNVTVTEGENVIVLKFKKNTSTGLENTVNTRVSVFPTVANGNVTVDLNSQTGTIRVFDMTGKMIHSRRAASSVENFELNGNGMFMFEIRTENFTDVVKVVNVK